MNVHLLNGQTAPRVKSSEGCVVLPCGCAHTEREWLQMCREHFDPWNAEHADALRAHAEAT